MPHFLLPDLFHHEKPEGQDHNSSCEKVNQAWIQLPVQVLGPYRDQLDSILGTDGLGDPGEAKI